jgi:hypothetical protein
MGRLAIQRDRPCTLTPALGQATPGPDNDATPATASGLLRRALKEPIDTNRLRSALVLPGEGTAQISTAR